MLIFNLITAAFGFMFLIPFGVVVQTVLVGGSRFFTSNYSTDVGYGLAIVPQMQNESFPHKYRSVAWGYI